jgi:5-methylcytosine-specific restriction endonuclease McrA
MVRPLYPLPCTHTTHTPHTQNLSVAATFNMPKTKPINAIGYNCINVLVQKAINKVKTKAKNRARENARNMADPQANRDRVVKWKMDNPERKASSDKSWFQRNRTQRLESMKEYSKNNRDALNQSVKRRESERRKTDPVFIITKRMRARLGAFTRSKNVPKQGHTFILIGTSPTGLVGHLQAQAPGEDLKVMQTDHIFPLSRYNIGSEVAQSMAMHKSNLQPLTRKENNDKADRLPTKAMAAKVARWAWPPGITEDMLPDIYPGWSTPLRM